METVDNLYKHMTIWGVLLLVFSLVYPFSQVHKFNLESFDVQAQTAVDIRIHENLLAERNRLVEQEKAGFSNEQRLAEIDEDLLPQIEAITRTDAAAEGIDQAVARARLYLDAGADVIFPEALTSEDDFRRLRAAVDAPLLARFVGPVDAGDDGAHLERTKSFDEPGSNQGFFIFFQIDPT